MMLTPEKRLTHTNLVITYIMLGRHEQDCQTCLDPYDGPCAIWAQLSLDWFMAKELDSQ